MVYKFIKTEHVVEADGSLFSRLCKIQEKYSKFPVKISSSTNFLMRKREVGSVYLSRVKRRKKKSKSLRAHLQFKNHR